MRLTDARVASLRPVPGKPQTEFYHDRTPQAGIRVGKDGRQETIAARILINAAGPWVGAVAAEVIHANAAAPVRKPARTASVMGNRGDIRS